MASMMRVATASVLAISIAILPIVLDRCAASCEADHDATASTPSCHHASTATPRIGHVPVPCGHDNSGTVVIAAKAAPSLLPYGIASLVAIPAPPPSPKIDRHARMTAPPGSSLTLDGRSLPFRI